MFRKINHEVADLPSREGHVADVQSVMADMAEESSRVSSRACETEKVLGVPESSIQRLHLYPYKLQSLHQIMIANIAVKESFAK